MKWLRTQAARLLPHEWAVFHLSHFWLVVLLVVGPALAIGGSVAAVHWPYRYREVHPLLEDVFGYQVKIQRYHRTYFPHPGFIATGITLRRKLDPGTAPLGTVQTLSVVGRWRDLLLLRRRVRLVEMTGFHLVLPAPRASAAPTTPTLGTPDSSSSATAAPNTPGSHMVPSAAPHGRTDGYKGPITPVELIVIHNSALDILRVNGGRYSFAIRELRVEGVQRDHVMHYVVDMENPLPAGHISASGTFGPIDPDHPGATPVSGQFTFNQITLSDIGILRGTLASSGRFHGVLGSIQAEANSDTPDFAVGDGRPTHLSGSILCTINGLNGDVFMHQVEVESGRTIIRAQGEVAGSPKITHLDVEMENGRAEEVLRPFIHDQVPILGPASLHAKVYVAAPGRPFLQRLVLDGRFDAPAEKNTDRRIEQSLSAFSGREEKYAQSSRASDDPPFTGTEVLSSIRGPAAIRDGVISTPGIRFRVPGAAALLHGTFLLDNEAVHLTGKLKMDAAIPHVTTGWKSFFLTFLQPFFQRKNHAGSSIPIAVVGTPAHYQVRQNVLR